MLGNCEKMVLISSTPNEWPQNNQIDDHKTSYNNNNNNMGSVGARVMDQKLASITTQDHHHQQQQQIQKQQNQEPLRCPRCDSTNTKFCYYNNYSLSQPRHFCKACKRYWTRGGTLRNVPVGGGCRKNKRVKRPSTSSCSSMTSSSIDASSVNSGSSNSGHIHELISSGSNHVNPLFYGLPTSHNPGSDMNFPFSRYDLQNPPQITGLGLGYHGLNGDQSEFRNGLGGGFHIPTSKQIFQDLISSSNPLLSNSSSTPTISSLLGSSLNLKGSNNFQTLLPSYDHHQNDLQIKEVKMELEGQNRSLDHHHHHHHWSNSSQNQMDQVMVSSSDPSLLWGSGVSNNNNNNNLGAWLDPSNNLGSSVPSLI